MFLSCSLKPHWLRHIDLLFKITMEKDGLHVELIKLQLLLFHQCQKNLNRRVLHNGWEYVIVVNAFSLRVAFSYQYGFVAYNITIKRSLFLCKYSLITDRLIFSSVVLMYRTHFFHHGIFSHLELWTDFSFPICRWDCLVKTGRA